MPRMLLRGLKWQLLLLRNAVQIGIWMPKYASERSSSTLKHFYPFPESLTGFSEPFFTLEVHSCINQNSIFPLINGSLPQGIEVSAAQFSMYTHQHMQGECTMAKCDHLVLLPPWDPYPDWQHRFPDQSQYIRPQASIKLPKYGWKQNKCQHHELQAALWEFFISCLMFTCRTEALHLLNN